MFSFLKKKSPPVSLAPLKVDIHSHLLPGIDDGAKTMDHTIGMLRKFSAFGYEKLIVTPHVMKGVYNNTPAIIQEKLEEVRAVIAELQLPLEIDASAEYYLDDYFLELIKTDGLLPFHGNHILFECSFRDEPMLLDQAVFQLQSKRFQPVIAHFERYLYYHGSVEKAKQLKQAGVLIQVNALSLTGHYGPDVKKQAELLLKNNLIDILGSDCHRIEHLQIIEQHLGAKSFSQLMELPLRNANFR